MDKKKTLLEFFAENKFIHTILSIVIGFLVGAVFLAVMGISVSEAYGKLFQSVFSNVKSPWGAPRPGLFNAPGPGGRRPPPGRCGA